MRGRWGPVCLLCCLALPMLGCRTGAPRSFSQWMSDPFGREAALERCIAERAAEAEGMSADDDKPVEVVSDADMDELRDRQNRTLREALAEKPAGEIAGETELAAARMAPATPSEDRIPFGEAAGAAPTPDSAAGGLRGLVDAEFPELSHETRMELARQLASVPADEQQTMLEGHRRMPPKLLTELVWQRAMHSDFPSRDAQQQTSAPALASGTPPATPRVQQAGYHAGLGTTPWPERQAAPASLGGPAGNGVTPAMHHAAHSASGLPSATEASYLPGTTPSSGTYNAGYPEMNPAASMTPAPAVCGPNGCPPGVTHTTGMPSQQPPHSGMPSPTATDPFAAPPGQAYGGVFQNPAPTVPASYSPGAAGMNMTPAPVGSPPPGATAPPPGLPNSPFPSSSGIDPFAAAPGPGWSSGSPAPTNASGFGSAASFEHGPAGTSTRPLAPATGSTTATPSEWRSELLNAVRLLEAETLRPTKPLSEAERERQAATLRLLSLLAGREEDAVRPIPGLSSSRQQFWQSLGWGLATYLDVERFPESDTRSALALRQFEQAAGHLAADAELELPRVVFCESIDGFGRYDAVAQPTFNAGQEVMLYVELRNFTSDFDPQSGEFQTRLRSRIDLLRGEEPQPIESFDFDSSTDICRNRRHDFYHLYTFFLPQTVRAGEYRVEIMIEDEIGRKVATTSLPFEVAAGL